MPQSQTSPIVPLKPKQRATDNAGKKEVKLKPNSNETVETSTHNAINGKKRSISRKDEGKVNQANIPTSTQTTSKRTTVSVGDSMVSQL